MVVSSWSENRMQEFLKAKQNCSFYSAFAMDLVSQSNMSPEQRSLYFLSIETRKHFHILVITPLNHEIPWREI
jgi:hypothetical protein